LDANRIARFTVAGWAFILSWTLHLWMLGTDFSAVTGGLSSVGSLPTAIAGVLVGLAASPILGFIISSFAYAITRLLRGGDAEFDVPRPREDFTRFLDSLTALLPTDESKSSLSAIIPPETVAKSWWHRRKFQKGIDALLPYFNLLFHTRAPSILIEYTTRRWTIYWIYANSICALVIGIFFALLTSGNFFARSPVSFWDVRYLIEAALACFIILGFARMHQIRKQIYDIAWLWLYAEARR
jgi:hypothetical protein